MRYELQLQSYLYYICTILIIMHKILIVDDERPARDWLSGLVAFYIPNATVT